MPIANTRPQPRMPPAPLRVIPSGRTRLPNVWRVSGWPRQYLEDAGVRRPLEALVR